MDIVANEPGAGTARVVLTLRRSKVSDARGLAATLSRRIRSKAARTARRAGGAR
jgi:hypothetical protein